MRFIIGYGIALGLLLGSAIIASKAKAFGPLPLNAQCRSLEALGRLAADAVARGVKPTPRQLASYEARKAWYDRYCRNA